MNPIRLLIVDDQALFREALTSLLRAETSVTVVGEAADGLQAIDAVASLRPAVVLMDLRMPGMGGIEATRKICNEHPDTKVLVLTTFEEDEDVFAAIHAGAVGYLLKAAPAAKLIEAIAAVAKGESVLQPSVTKKLLAEYNRLATQSRRRTHQPLTEPLSARELAVLSALTEGLSNKEIAVRLAISEGTVKNHMTQVLGKLGVLDRTQAALRARELGLI